MCSAIAHRGPDARGMVAAAPTSILGHLRLSIQDTDARSNQPFVRDGLTIVFNGEIYNFLELKAGMPEVNFATTSDTEVLLEGWRRWGPAFLDRVRGMYAFAIHDARTDETWLARDPLGIKPLLVLQRSDGIAFASELKALERAFRAELALDEDALAASLLWVWVPEERCVWRQVRKLPPGALLRVGSDGVAREHSRIGVDAMLPPAADLADEGAAVAELDRVLAASVRAHLVADVPVNAFLSGGLDSSLIVALARRDLPALDCFAIRFDESDRRAEAMSSDARYADMVARYVGARLHVIDARPDMARLLPRIVDVLDEPIGDSAAIATLMICESARAAGVKVLLSGMGADELFAGYRKHRACAIAETYRRSVPAVVRAAGERLVKALPVAIGGRGLRPTRWARRFASFASLEPADAFMRSYSYFDRADFARLVRDGAARYEAEARMHHAVYARAPVGDDAVNRMCYTDVHRFMVALNETYTDRASMAASTEVRVPFIDREVVRTAFRVPGALKLRGGEAKYVLKRVAESYLPREVVYRPKASFGLPLRAWVRRELADLVRDYVVSPNGLAGRGWLDAAELRRIVEDDAVGRADNAQTIWQLLTLEQWLRNRGL
jgi:asparagine synthase (glutamine-hydrolysing)